MQAGEAQVAHTMLFGLGDAGEVQHTELLAESDPATLRQLAEDRLRRFHAVEVWVESVRLLHLRQAG